jgi:transcriptional regulator with XRE-family HTH domain
MKTKKNTATHYSIGTLIQRLRKERRWKQKDLASRLGRGFSISKISKWENEDTALKFDDIVALSQAFETPISSMFKDLGAPISKSELKSMEKLKSLNDLMSQFQIERIAPLSKWPLIAIVATVGCALIIATLSAFVYFREYHNLKTGNYSLIDSCQVWIDTSELKSSPRLNRACSATTPVVSLIGQSIARPFEIVSSPASDQIIDCNAQSNSIGLSKLIYPLH